jgi:anti-anti-sigma factor
MEMTKSKSGDTLVFSVQGRLDAQTSPQAEKDLKLWMAEGEKKLVGDLSGLDYISSAGLRLMLMVAKGAKGQGGGLCLFGLSPSVHEVFTIAGFTKIIPIAASLDDALAL